MDSHNFLILSNARCAEKNTTKTVFSTSSVRLGVQDFPPPLSPPERGCKWLSVHVILPDPVGKGPCRRGLSPLDPSPGVVVLDQQGRDSGPLGGGRGGGGWHKASASDWKRGGGGWLDEGIRTLASQRTLGANIFGRRVGQLSLCLQPLGIPPMPPLACFT